MISTGTDRRGTEITNGIHYPPWWHTELFELTTACSKALEMSVANAIIMHLV